MSRSTRNTTALHAQGINSGLFDSGRPILLASPSPPDQIGTNVLIAWNRSTEQARATALAMPLLERADQITVLTIVGGTEVSGPSAEQLVQNLRRHRIAAELKRVGLDGKSTGETILATAQSLGCDLLIKGAYTQSRLRQLIFGGATQHVLENAMIPVLLAN
jgi:nucleotide-binding universal stress UspA family protein